MDELHDRLHEHLINRTFGALRFWGSCPFRPHDDWYDVVATHRDGDRLDLVYVHASRRSHAGVVSIFAPEGLRLDAGGLRIERAAQIRMDATEYTAEGDHYRVRKPEGDFRFPKDGAAALTVEF
jgi:hypothetical protein